VKILFIRHGDPDYVHDSLTEKGFIEAKLLAEKLKDVNIDYYYVSPLGRAKDTASFTLEKKGVKAVECDWLREFDAPIWRPDVTEKRMIPWDWLPQDRCTYEDFFSYDKWMSHPSMVEGAVYEEYKRVTGNFDALLEKHGYVRNGHYYNAVNPNNDTIALFCHFGVSCILVSYLLSISPIVALHGFCAPPSSVTTLVTEERRRGIASFRMNSYGDVSHLYVAGEKPSPAASFCECFDNEWQRHD